MKLVRRRARNQALAKLDVAEQLQRSQGESDKEEDEYYAELNKVDETEPREASPEPQAEPELPEPERADTEDAQQEDAQWEAELMAEVEAASSEEVD